MKFDFRELSLFQAIGLFVLGIFLLSTCSFVFTMVSTGLHKIFFF